MYENVLAYLEDRTGLALRNSRRKDVVGVLSKVKQKFGLADADELLNRLQVDRRIFDAVMAGITVGETYFLREPAQMEAIRRIILPALLRGRTDSRPLRFWSAGCSTGEEAYSLAMIADKEGVLDRISVLGTDICGAALSKARRAEFRRWSLRADREGQLARYFKRSGDRFKLVERLRERVSFDVLNLASSTYRSAPTGAEAFDLVLCRNVLIYFSSGHIPGVARKLYDCLGEGGWLVTGPSDPPLWDHAPFRTVIVPGAVLYRREAQSARRDRPAATRMHASMRRMPLAASVRASDAPQQLRRSTAASAAKRSLPAQPAPVPEDEEPESVEAWVGVVKTLSRQASLPEAEASLEKALAQFPLSADLNYMRSLVLIALDRHKEAIEALRRVLYLDRSLAVAHLALGMLTWREGDIDATRRSLENAIRLCSARPPSDEIPLCDGETAHQLIEGARARLAQLNRGSAA